MNGNEGTRGHPPPPEASDNGNTDLPTVVNTVTNSDSNTFLPNGTLYGEANYIPSKFLSAKNSIEIHKNKVLTNNQSLPNVHHHNHGLASGTLHSSSIFHPHSRSKRAFTYETGSGHHDKSFIEQKTAKTVNWAPVPPVVAPKEEEEIVKVSDDKQETPVNLLVSKESNDNGQKEDPKIKEPETETDSNNCSSTVPSLTCQYQSPNSQDIDKVLSPTQSQTSLYVSNLPSVNDSTNSPPQSLTQDSSPETRPPLELSNRFSNTDLSYYQHTETGEVGINFDPPAYNTGGCPSPLLVNHDSKAEIISSAPVEMEVSPESIHPPPENPPPPTYQNQGQQVDNHNYDTDEDPGEQENQSSVLSMVNPRDLPVPDADYVARVIPVEMHGFLTRKCKKDCRTWLWKSAAKRKAILEEQKRLND